MRRIDPTTPAPDKNGKAMNISADEVQTSLLVLECSDFGVLGDDWTWQTFVRARKDGRFSCRMVQHGSREAGGGSYRPAGLVGFRTGDDLFTYLWNAWPEHTGNELGESDLAGVVAEIGQLSTKLSAELAAAVREQFHPSPPPPPRPPTALELHAQQATWERQLWSGAGGMVAMYEHSIRRSAANVYAQRYFAAHGKLPEGVHRVDFSVGPPNSKADIKSNISSTERRLVENITYPHTLSQTGGPG